MVVAMNDNIEEHKTGKFDLSISVLNSKENWVQLPGFDITVTKAISVILEKLNLPSRSENDVRLKYFLVRMSDNTNDGFDILAEYDKNGNPNVLADYGITNGVRLNISAMILPTGESSVQFRDGEELNYDDEIIEI